MLFFLCQCGAAKGLTLPSGVRAGKANTLITFFKYQLSGHIQVMFRNDQQSTRFLQEGLKCAVGKM